MLPPVAALCTVHAVTIELRPLTRADAEAHCAGEDEQTVHWLTGGYGTVEGTTVYFDWLAGNAAAARGKRGFGVWLDRRLAGYVDCDPDVGDGLEAVDVNVSYAVHPRAPRSRGGSRGSPADLRAYRDEPDRQACGDPGRTGKQGVGTGRAQMWLQLRA